MLDSPQIIEAARSGAGFGWHEHGSDVHEGCERFFRPGYNANLVARVAARARRRRRQAGARRAVADVGCGHGASTILMAQAFPNSTFVGSDYHDGSIDDGARSGPRRPGSATGSASRSPRRRPTRGVGYDLVTMFDCLHDMGDPVGAARHVRETLAARRHLDDRRAERRRPGRGQPQPGRAGPTTRFSTLLCTPASLSQEVGLALGAQAGEARIRDVVTAAGFTRFRRAAETPFNSVFEARP